MIEVVDNQRLAIEINTGRYNMAIVSDGKSITTMIDEESGFIVKQEGRGDIGQMAFTFLDPNSDVKSQFGKDYFPFMVDIGRRHPNQTPVADDGAEQTCRYRLSGSDLEYVFAPYFSLFPELIQLVRSVIVSSVKCYFARIGDRHADEVGIY